jgi:hypothetical protein
LRRVWSSASRVARRVEEEARVVVEEVGGAEGLVEIEVAVDEAEGEGGGGV